ncbi:MAG: hypothetical protein Q4G11_07010, partial [Gallicola sp.]|nr:hypothetical protein [Gallicola sp.]
MKKLNEMAENIFSITLFIALLGGGIIAFLFLAALIMGGVSGEALALTTKSNVLPWFIRLATLSLVSGLVQIYTSGQHALTMESGSK